MIPKEKWDEYITKNWCIHPPSYIARKLNVTAREVVVRGGRLGLEKIDYRNKNRGFEDKTPTQIAPWPDVIQSGKVRFTDALMKTKLRLIDSHDRETLLGRRQK